MFRGKGPRRSLALIAVSVVCLASAAVAAAAPGLDPTYGEGGILRIESQLPAGYAEGENAGKALAGANASVLFISELTTCAKPYETGCRIPETVRRFTPDGSLDRTYGEGGVLNLGSGNGYPHPVEATDPRGRLFVGESHEGTISIRRFTARGKIDSQFGSAGRVSLSGFAAKETAPVAILMAPKEHLVVAIAESREDEYAHAAARVTLFQLLPDGRLDRSFGNAGKAVVGIASSYSVRAYETPAGATLVVAKNCCSADDFTPVHRVSAAGRVDTHFNAQERRAQVKALADFAEPEITSVVPRSDGAIELFGTSQGEDDPVGPSYVLRLRADGTAESRFGEGGVMTLGPLLSAAAAGSGGSTLVAFGPAGPQAEGRGHVERLLSDGRPDPRLGGEAGVWMPEAGGTAGLVTSPDGTALVVVIAEKNCQLHCELSPYLVRLIEPSAMVGAGKGGKH